MGMHPEATLFYGVAFDEDAELPDWLVEAHENGEDIEELIFDRLLAAAGIDPGDDWSARWSAQRELGVEFGQACNFAYGEEELRFYLSVHTAAACTYGPVRIDPSALDVNYASLNDEISSALEALGIPEPADGFGWHLAAAYR